MQGLQKGIHGSPVKPAPQVYAEKDKNGNIVSHQYHDAETILKVLAECVSLVETSKNLDVVEGRRKLGLERAQILKDMETRGLHSGSPSSSEFTSYFENEALEYVNRLKNPAHYDAMSGHGFEEFYKEFLRETETKANDIIDLHFAYNRWIEAT